MPTISIFFGFVVQMYWRDHPPPHVHVFYQGFEALIDIETRQIIRGTLPPAARRVAVEWVRRRESELLANWERGRLRQAFEAVPGADVE
jgi:Domain of unknown function (DUF4160)